MTRSSVAGRWLTAVTLLVSTLGAAPGGQSTDRVITIQGKFDTATEELLVPVRIAQRSFWCSLDSGYSALLALDRAKAVRAGLIDGSASALPTLTTAVALGSSGLANQSVMIRDLPAEAPDMDCIMGVGLLRAYVVEFDYDHARVRLEPRASFHPSESREVIPLVFRTNPNVPFVKMDVTLPDGSHQAAQVVVDTGASYYAGVFVSGAAERLRASHVSTAEPPQAPDSSKPGLAFVAARPRAITVGPFTLAQPVIALVSAGLGGGMDDGLLGNGFLRRFTVAFDFEGRRLYLTPNTHFGELQPFDSSGVAFRREPEGFVVDRVLPDSPAARAGLRPGDRLVQIDGRRTNGLTVVRLRELLSRPDATCQLDIRRDNRTLRIVIKEEHRL